MQQYENKILLKKMFKQNKRDFKYSTRKDNFQQIKIEIGSCRWLNGDGCVVVCLSKNNPKELLI